MANRKNHPENIMPIVDDGWWNSVLSEEGHHVPQHPAKAPGRHENRPEAARKTKVEEAQKPQVDWDRIRELYSKDQIVSLPVTRCNRGGLLVEAEGLSGFVPFSHLVDLAGRVDPLERERSLEAYIGRTLNLKVIECMPEDGRIVFSERAALAEPGRRAELFHSLHSGEQISGVVTNVTDFGVFVDLGGVEGLIHISELSWGRVAHPSQIASVGQAIEVKVLDLSQERCRVALSLKRLFPNPWDKIGIEIKLGQIAPAVITSILSYGAFARLELGVEGLIHVTEIPLGAAQGIKDFLTEGQQVQVRILHVDPQHQRMGLSLRLDP